MAASAFPSTSAPYTPLLPRFPRHRIPRQFRLRRRKSAAIRVRSQLFSDEFISHLPSLNSLSLAALSFASGLAIALPSLNLGPRAPDFGDWILFTSPTPFNRFVLLRCPTISFDGVQDVNERLLKEERHYVRLNSGGRIPAKAGSQEVEYSRVCVATSDGGVIALDWPSDLDLNDEHGLDSTVLVIPGSAEGSSDQNVKDFVLQCLNRGLFPVVMNPRGCAGSPLTTSRLFTAADSDDVSSAVQFLSRARPWSTFMAVGWGFGANMLTKYLVEVGEKTPLTAATCIDNPFDLEEVTRISVSRDVVDQKLTGGLIDILKSNKGLFHGRNKGFDVEKALSARSVRDFDTAISMVSHGFDTIEEFYSKSSSRLMMGNIKVPVLFIQSDDGSVPLFSIPREDIADNMFTSLLLCSSLPSNNASRKSVIMWSQELTIEWLMAVELAFLKGRHPLLTDVDVTINPSKGLAIAEGWTSDAGEEHDTVFNQQKELKGSNGYLLKPLKNHILQVQDEYDSGTQPVARKDTYELPDGDYRQVIGVLPQSDLVNAELDKPESTDAVEGDKGQAMQSAKVVMNMLDMTMPGTLTEEKKKKVLTALDQGETLIKALEGAVPEDVRGKLTSSASEILQTQGKNLNFDGLSTGLANMSSKFKGKFGGNEQKKPDDGNGSMSIHSSELLSSSHDSTGSSSNKKISEDKNSGENHDVVSQEKSLQDSSDSSSNDNASAGKSSGGSDDIVLSQEKSVNDSSESSSNKNASVERGSEESDAIVPSQDKSVSDLSDSSGNSKASVDKNSGESVDKVQPQKKSGNDSSDSGSDNKISEDKSSGAGDDIVLLQEKSVKSSNSNEPQSSKSMPTMENNDPISQSDDNGQVASTTSVSQQENPPGSEEVTNKSPEDPLQDTNKTGEPINGNEGSLQSNQKAPGSQPSEKQDTETKNADEKSVPLNLDQNKSASDTKAPAFSVSQAFDALTSMDDSTQLAVNSVFGVLEGMIDQLEEKREDNHTEQEGNVENTKDGNDPQEVTSSLDIQSVDKNGKHSGVLQNNTSAVSDEGSDKLVGRKQELMKYPKINDLYLFKANKAYAEAVYNGYLQKLFESNIKRGDKHLGLDTNSPLFLDYIPEEGQWKLLEEPDSNQDELKESPCTVLDSDKKLDPVSRRSTGRLDDLTQTVKNIVLESLHVEVSRKLIGVEAKEMETSLVRDMEEVANAVAMAVRHDKEHNWCLSSDVDCTLEQGNGFDGAHIIETISSSVKNTKTLRRMVPVGVVVGSTLASLKKFFYVSSVQHEYQNEAMNLDEDDAESKMPRSELVAKEVVEVLSPGEPELCLSKPPAILSIDSKPTIVEQVEKKDEKSSDGVLSSDTVMVGAVTAALGATAIFHEYNKGTTGTTESPSEKTKYPNKNQAINLEGATDDKHQNMVVSLAEKAMSVAAPVMPTKQDGGVDQERLVAMLSELGQKGGILRLFGKLALLWGGIRGALSLTNKLIGFLLIADRPLIQRLLAFGCLVIILWSPVAIPFLPTLVQNWMTKSPSGIAELVCTLGLYIAVAGLIVLWGKKIRGYENPLRQYGLDSISSDNVQDLLVGLTGGFMLVLSIHSVNALLGFVDLSWPLSLISSPVDHTMKFQSWVKLVLLAVQGVLTAIAIASIEELFFRSWLAEEIGIDLGDHRGILLSGLAFSICQSSLLAIPGLWLLSLSLAGERQRKQGSLYSPIGLRAGIMASCYVLQKGGFLIYRPNLPLWMTGTHPFQPFSGVVGLVFSLVLALVLYPRHLNREQEMRVTVQE